MLLAGLAAAPASAAVIGPGPVATTGADSGDRLNIADDSGFTLDPGTYSVDNFSFFSTGVGGTVPFLATGTGNADAYSLLWIGSAVAGAQDAAASANPVGRFTLGSSTTVFGGFYTTGGRVAFANSGTTDHAGVVAVPRGGVVIGTFSNPNLARTYAFSITATLSNRREAGPGFLSNGGADSGDRLNVDNVNPLSLTAGKYRVADFSYIGTSAVGTVTPFLARLTGTDTYQAVWVGSPAANQIGGVEVAGDEFTLAGDDTLYAGFYTAGGATVAFTEGPGRPPGFGLTDHDSTFTGPTAAGDFINGFSNADLPRQYSFSIGVTEVPEPTAAGGLAATAAGLLLRRRRRD